MKFGSDRNQNDMYSHGVHFIGKGRRPKVDPGAVSSIQESEEREPEEKARMRYPVREEGKLE